MKNSKVPACLFIIYAIVFVWSAINPFDHSVWFTEAITSLVPVVILVIMYLKKIRLSNLAYILMAIFPTMHAIGAHYTFALVPFDWFNHMFGFTRNMYDRVAHFTVGFYAFGISELIYVRGLVKNRFIAWTYGLFFIMALAAAYEIFEWQYAVNADPNAGLAILGSQGDIWDTQKDMLMDTLGAVVAVILFQFQKNKKSK